MSEQNFMEIFQIVVEIFESESKGRTNQPINQENMANMAKMQGHLHIYLMCTYFHIKIIKIKWTATLFIITNHFENVTPCLVN